MIWEGIARHGRPIQYAYVPEPLAIWDTWTSIASRPVAFEAPSAGFVLDWAMLRAIRARGAQFATLTHAAGISSTGDAGLDALLPFDEPYFDPGGDRGAHRADERQAAASSRSARPSCGRSSTAARRTWPREGGRRTGNATGRAHGFAAPRGRDAIVSGLHERAAATTSCCGRSRRPRAGADDREADAGGYRAHEFGDAVFISRAAGQISRNAEPERVIRSRYTPMYSTPITRPSTQKSRRLMYPLA